MKKILIPILLIVVVAAAVGYYMYNKPVASLEKKEADVSVSADQLLTDYETNESEANKKYLGKVVEVNGTVSALTTEEGKHKVQLETSNPIASVIFELEEGKSIDDLQVGEEAKIKGMCSGYLSDVILVQSTVVNK
jgi:hypothetical protein